MEKGNKGTQKQPDEIKIIKDPHLNVYGDCSVNNEDGSYFIPKNNNSTETYLSFVKDLQRPVKVEAWTKIDKDDEYDDVCGRMQILSPRSEKGGQSLKVKKDSCLWKINHFSLTEDREESDTFGKIENYAEWHKVVIDARSDNTVVYQVHQNGKILEHIAEDRNIQVGTIKFFSRQIGVHVKDIKITQTIKKEVKTVHEELSENEFIEIDDSAPLYLRHFSFKEGINNQPHVTQPDVSKAFDGQYLYVID